MCVESVKTHPDFKSIIPAVTDADTMDDYVGLALGYQFMFDRRTTPWEMDQWDQNQLQSFKIDLGEVDRLYHIYFYDDNCSGQDYQLVARVNHDGQPLYVELVAGCDYTGFDCQGHGVIFVSRDANLFMRLVLTSDFRKDLVYQSLTEDGIEVEEHIDYDACSRMMKKSAPMLKYLCHEAAYKNRVKLRPHFLCLPKILSNSVDEFIRFKEAKDVYDECY